MSRRAATSSDIEEMLAKAAALREEVRVLEEEEMSMKTIEKGSTEAVAGPGRLRITLPISKPDWSVEEEVVEFTSFYPVGSSEILRLEAQLPLGIVIEEFDRGFIQVIETSPEGNAAQAGIEAGDIVRACTGVKVQMELPTWQLLAGGIGKPKSFRFMFPTDRQPFETVMEAIGSNRMDTEGRPVLLCVERKISPSSDATPEN